MFIKKINNFFGTENNNGMARELIAIENLAGKVLGRVVGGKLMTDGISFRVEFEKGTLDEVKVGNDLEFHLKVRKDGSN